MSDLAKNRQQQRLEFIDLCAYVLGCINRKILMSRFDVKEAWGTKDFNEYRSLSGESIIYDHALRAYKPTDWFSPLFEHKASDAIQLLSQGSQNITCEKRFADRVNDYSVKSVEPDLEKIHCVLRSLYLKKKVEINYLSLSSGGSRRVIAPHSIIKTGSFQYVRAFDHKSGEFRSFKLNRIINSKLIDFTPLDSESQNADEEWNQMVTLKIVANECLSKKEAIEFDFGLVDGELIIKIKKAMVMYFLMDWNIAPIEYPHLPTELFPLKLVSVYESQ